MEIQGKTALITGGAVRVGRVISLALAQAGANIAVHYHASGNEAETVIAEARSLGVQAASFQADLAEPGQAEALARQVLQRFGGVDILVYGASHFQTTPFPAADPVLFRRITAVSIDGAFHLVNALAPTMRERGSGCIITLVDSSAWKPWHNFTAHAVGKAGLLALTRQFALELAPAVRANAIAPGPVLPPAHFTPEKIARDASRNPLGRWGSPRDVADAVLYLVKADFLTGVVLPVDGGESLR